MANIFDDLEVGKSVFKDKQPLDHRFLPENLPHRKEQITQIAKYWIEALNNVTPSDITIYGKTGTGKTAAARIYWKYDSRGDQCECSESGAWISCGIYRE